jgi:hypothetical protein
LLSQQVHDVATALAAPPYAVLTTTAGMVLTGSSQTQITFTAATAWGVDTQGSAPAYSGLVVSEAGLYDVSLQILAEITDTGSTSHIMSYVRVNGTTATRGIVSTLPAFRKSSRAAWLMPLSAGDTVTAYWYVTPGRTANLVPDAGSVHLTMELISPAEQGVS